jgi:hypothetical protein
MSSHQAAHVVSEHAGDHIPEDWVSTYVAAEETRLQNDIRGLDDAGKADAIGAFHEDMGDIYGNDAARLLLWDFAILNGDRNAGNAILSFPPGGGEGKVTPIDHGSSFDPPGPIDDFDGDPTDTESTFEWFMNYNLTRGWLNYILGGLDLGGNVSEATLRSILEDFLDSYGRLDKDAILDAFRSMPGVTDKQIERVDISLDGVIDRITWMRDNKETVYKRLTERRPST